VVVRIGHLRFTEHRTRAEIWRAVRDETPVRLSERHVQNLVEVYLALLRASQQDVGACVAATAAAHGGIVVALDGLQPEQGNEQLWVVREVLSGAILGAADLQQATAECLAALLRPIRAAGVPVLGVVSDAQESIRLAVADVFPGVPHQLCQYHALREAAEPLWEADRHLLVEAKQELRGLREVEERTRRRDPEGAAAAGAVVLDTVLALRQTVRERGSLPFDFAALRVVDDLAAVGAPSTGASKKGGRAPGPAPHPGGAGRGARHRAGRRVARGPRSPPRGGPPPGARAGPRHRAAAARRRGARPGGGPPG
jgi:hypothetical protein